MKVCLLMPELLPIRGGVGKFGCDLIKSIPPAVDLTVLTVERRTGSEHITAEEMEAYFGHRARVEVLTEAKDSFLFNGEFQLDVLRWMRRRFAEERFDLVHSQHAPMPDLLSRLLCPPSVTVRSMHTTLKGQREGILAAQRYGGKPDPTERWQLALRPLLDLAEWSILARHDYTVAPSEWMRQQLIANGHPAERVTVVYNCVETDRFRPLPSGRRRLTTHEGAPTVLFSGRPTMVKGAAILARAIPRILRDVPTAEFVFTGAAKEEFLPLLGDHSDVAAHIRFLGFLPQDELPKVVASTDLFVAPSLYENLPIRILDAMSCGVPVVASNICGIPEAVLHEETGLLVPPGSDEALAAGVVRLLKDPALRSRLSRRAREFAVSRFGLDTFGAAMLRAYQRALGSGG